MANQELYNKTYSVPSAVLSHIQSVLVSTPQGNGVKRAKFIVKNGHLTYQELKRLKNYFDYFNPQTQSSAEYELAGGKLMKDFVERTLNSERSGVERSKQLRQDINTNPNSELKPYQTPRLTEAKEDLKKNAVAVIVNNDNKILLLKRADEPKMWQPNKWALVGGGIEKGETPEKACKREIKEETGLEVEKLVDAFTIQRHKDSIEHLFACRYDGEPTDVTLNGENTKYGWFGAEEIKFLDTVPHLMEYIVLTFKNYDE